MKFSPSLSTPYLSKYEQGRDNGYRVRFVVSDSCRRPDDEPVSIHFGVAELRGDMTLTELVEMADLGLAAAKSEYGDR